MERVRLVGGDWGQGVSHSVHCRLHSSSSSSSPSFPLPTSLLSKVEKTKRLGLTWPRCIHHALYTAGCIPPLPQPFVDPVLWSGTLLPSESISRLAHSVYAARHQYLHCTSLSEGEGGRPLSTSRTDFNSTLLPLDLQA